MPSFKAYEVRDAFASIQEGNRKALSALQRSVQAIAAEKAKAQEIYRAELGQYILLTLAERDSRPSQLAALDEAFTETLPQNKVLIAQRHYTVNVEYSKVHGSGQTRWTLEYMAKHRRMSSIDAFNDEYKNSNRPLIDAAGISYFSSKSGLSLMAATVFDGHYRNGQALIRAFRRDNGVDIITYRAQLEEMRLAREEVKQRFEALKTEAENPPTAEKITEIRQSIFAADIQPEVAKTLLLHYFDDLLFFQTAAAYSQPELFPDAAIGARAKIEGFAKMEESLSGNIDALKKANEQLDKPLSNLKKACSHGKSYKSIDIDLDDVKAKFAQLQDMSFKRATGVERVGLNLAAQDFDVPSLRGLSGEGALRGTSTAATRGAEGSDLLTQYMTFIMASMLLDDGAGGDSALIRATFNGVDLDSAGLSQDFSAATGGLGGMGNDWSVHIDTNINIDVSVNVSDFNAGGYGGGMDAGGGCD